MAALCRVSLHGHRWEASAVRRAGAQHTRSTSFAGEGRALSANKGCALEEGAQCEEWWEQLCGWQSLVMSTTTRAEKMLEKVLSALPAGRPTSLWTWPSPLSVRSSLGVTGGKLAS